MNGSRSGIEHFDAMAASWEEQPGRVELARAIAAAILQRVAPAGRERALEFGCGTGLLTALMAPRLGGVVAIDSSAAMLDVLARKIRGQDLRNVVPVEADIEDGIPEGPFDLIYASMTLHHIADVPGLLAAARAALAAGAWIALADLASEDGSFHGGRVPGVIHHGFAPEQLAGWLRDAGFVQLEVRPVYRILRTLEDGSPGEYPVLLASARRDANGRTAHA